MLELLLPVNVATTLLLLLLLLLLLAPGLEMACQGGEFRDPARLDRRWYCFVVDPRSNACASGYGDGGGRYGDEDEAIDEDGPCVTGRLGPPEDEVMKEGETEEETEGDGDGEGQEDAEATENPETTDGDEYAAEPDADRPSSRRGVGGGVSVGISDGGMPDASLIGDASAWAIMPHSWFWSASQPFK
ncbi:hypothetical protein CAUPRSCDRAFT_11927 [Caulochytrium protostelioides]|uniref:Uncharacterized protein n=1 Tax=Caulochytrium protostelioides TaxID=1555241 RepID=A0A4P9WVP1_9FUNG|nr:hypothetical protein CAUPRSCDRAFT_11927 [Caulochytrium protostelioides]